GISILAVTARRRTPAIAISFRRESKASATEADPGTVPKGLRTTRRGVAAHSPRVRTIVPCVLESRGARNTTSDGPAGRDAAARTKGRLPMATELEKALQKAKYTALPLPDRKSTRLNSSHVKIS